MGKKIVLNKNKYFKVVPYRFQTSVVDAVVVVFVFLFFKNNFTKIRSIVLFLEEFQNLYLSWNWMK